MDPIMEHFSQNHSSIYFLLAGLSLVLEIAVIGLSGPLLFFGVGCALTGVFISLGLITGFEWEILSVGLFSLATAGVLWKPLKQFQGTAKVVDDTSSDMIGQKVPVSEELTATGGSIRHSGINWSARLDDSVMADAIAPGEIVVITATKGNVMIAKPME